MPPYVNLALNFYPQDCGTVKSFLTSLCTNLTTGLSKKQVQNNVKSKNILSHTFNKKSFYNMVKKNVLSWSWPIFNHFSFAHYKAKELFSIMWKQSDKGFFLDFYVWIVINTQRILIIEAYSLTYLFIWKKASLYITLIDFP